MKITPMWIESKLAQLPNLIAIACEKYEIAREQWMNEEADYDRLFAKEYLRAKAEGNTEGQAKQMAVEKLYEKKLSLVKMEAECRRLQNEVSKLENQFNAVRKIANLKEVEIKTTLN